MGLFGGNATTANAKIKVGYEGKAAQRGLDGLGRSSKRLGGIFSSTGAKVAIASAAIVALTMILMKAKKALDFTTQAAVKFEHARSRLKAILKPTAKEFEALEKQAQKLGATTVFTATQVMEAFTEMGKLGAETNEILAAGNEVLSLAALAQVDMAMAATVTIQTLNQFQLSADEAGRVVDVIAKSFTSSALDITKFSEALRYVGPIAGTTGEELEEVAGALAVLADNAVDSSLAGTGMRRILLELANENSKASKVIAATGKEAKTLSDKFKILSEIGMDATESTRLFGLRATTAAQILSKSSDEISRMAEEFRNADGAAKEMAETMLDDVEGASIRLKSVQEGLALSIKDKMLPVMRWWKESLIDVFSWLKAVIDKSQGAKFAFKQLKIEQSLLKENEIRRQLTDVTDEQFLKEQELARFEKSRSNWGFQAQKAKREGLKTEIADLTERRKELEIQLRLEKGLKETREEGLKSVIQQRDKKRGGVDPTGLTAEQIKAAEKDAEDMLKLQEDFEKEILRMKDEAHKKSIKKYKKEQRERADIIKQAESERASDVANIDQQYFNLRMESEDEFHKDKIARLEFQRELYPRLEVEINALIEAENDRHRDYEKEEDEKAMAERIALAESSLTSLNTINGALVAMVDARTTREIKNLEKLGLSEEEFEKRKEKIMEEGDEKRRAFARIQQGIAIGEAVVNTYKAAVGTYADTPGGIITRGLAMAAAIATGLAQVAVIQSQAFAMGGLVGDRQRTRQPDNINVMLGKGEYVTDAATTDKYISELEAMRAGTYDKQHGGSVVYNIYGVGNEQFLQLTVANERRNKNGLRL